MYALWEYLPWLLAMAFLMGCSAFFSASEAALFCLDSADRRDLVNGTPGHRAAAQLLSDPDRLLSAVLFWNLVVNFIYFAIGSMITLRLSGNDQASPSTEIVFTVSALLAIIFFSEMLPKSLAALQARPLSSLVGIPLAVAVRLVDPIIPTLRAVNVLSRRLIWPTFRAESSLEIVDLERAIEHSTKDQALVRQERTVLRNIVSLSELGVQEWMRPRTQFRAFRPPISLNDLRGRDLSSGYLFVAEHEREEVVAALPLRELVDIPAENLERFAEPVTVIPWCATVGDALQALRQEGQEVAVVVNELGEMIGVTTLPDILDAVFLDEPTRAERLLHRVPMARMGPDRWRVDGVTNLRRLAREFGARLPASHHATIGGVVQEVLERLPAVGDECEWGPLKMTVVSVSDTSLVLEVTPVEEEAAE